MPILGFKVDTTTYTLPGSSYVYGYNNTVSGYSECDLTIYPNSIADTTVLGYNFGENFAVKYDFKSNQIGFIQTATSAASAGTLMSHKMNALDVTLICAGAVGAVVLGFVGYKVYKKRQAKSSDNQPAEESLYRHDDKTVPKEEKSQAKSDKKSKYRHDEDDTTEDLRTSLNN